MSCGLGEATMKVYDNDSIGEIKERFVQEFVTADLKPCFDMNNMTATFKSTIVLMNDVLFSSLEKPVERIWFRSELWDDICGARRNLGRVIVTVCSGLEGVMGVQDYFNKYMEKLVENRRAQLGRVFDANDGDDGADDDGDAVDEQPDESDNEAD